MQAKQMLNEVGVTDWRGGGVEVERAFSNTHTSLYYKISGQAVLKKVRERPLLLSPDFSPLLYYNDGYADSMIMVIGVLLWIAEKAGNRKT